MSLHVGRLYPFLNPLKMCQWILWWTRDQGSHQIRLSSPKGKSLKTSETATAATVTDTVEVSTVGNAKPSNVTRRPKTIPEAKLLMREVHQRMPAWKADKLIEFYKTDQADLAALGEATGILFESKEMMSEAVQCLERIRKEKDGKEDAISDVSKASGSHSSHQTNKK